MLRVTAMSNYQSFRWLWRFDNEAKWFWLFHYLCGCNLNQDVIINLNDFGVYKL